MLEENYDIQYENDSTSNYLVLKLKSCRELIDYQVQMLLNNKIQGLLGFHINYVGNQINCFYDITSKCTLVNIMNRKRYIKSEMFNLIRLKELLENLLGQDIKRNIPNTSPAIIEKKTAEKSKPQIKRGEVKIPNLPSKESSGTNVDIKSKAFFKVFQ